MNGEKRERLYAVFKSMVLEHALCSSGDRVILSVSGGIDSMVLMELFTRLAPQIDLALCIAHVNHGLRGESSDADEALVRKRALHYGLPCEVAHLKPEVGGNLQDGARSCRYRFLQEVAKKRGAKVIGLAHHQGDQVETVLLHLLRGAGLCGLSGMRCSNELGAFRLIRPLLKVPRSTIEAYARRRRILFREDASNTSIRYRRNFIRLRLMPMLQEFNPRIASQIAMMCERLREDDETLEAVSQEAYRQILITESPEATTLRREEFAELPVGLRRRVLQAAFHRIAGSKADLKADQILRMDAIALSPRVKGQYDLPASVHFARMRDLLFLRREPKLEAPLRRSRQSKRRGDQ